MRHKCNNYLQWIILKNQSCQSIGTSPHQLDKRLQIEATLSFFSHLIPFSFVHWIRKFLTLSIIHHHPNDTKENSILLTIIILTMMMRWTNYFLFAFISCFRVFCKFIGYSQEFFLRKGWSIFIFDRTSINSGVICISFNSLLSII